MYGNSGSIAVVATGCNRETGGVCLFYFFKLSSKLIIKRKVRVRIVYPLARGGIG